MAIRQLDQDTISKIAAGEVVQRPVSALKELIENSLDAGATALKITVKDGGMSLLQVKDNGTGILEADLPILCYRFTTSKLSTLSDLSALSTFGFRGEALASMSHAAHLRVCTKHKDSDSGFIVEYLDGQMLQNPRPYPMTTGTTISVERLFERMAVRRNSLGSESDEYQVCLKLVQKYAVQYNTVSFSIGNDEKHTSFFSPGNDFSKMGVLQTIYSHPNLPSELIPIQLTHSNVTVEGFVSNARYSLNKADFILFINGRLVESEMLQTLVSKTYVSALPKVNFFAYLSLTVPPASLDPNIHPTKREVKFIGEMEVFSMIQQNVERELRKSQQQATLVVTVYKSKTSSSVKGPSQQVRTNWQEAQLDWKVNKVSLAKTEPDEKLRSVSELKKAIVAGELQTVFDECMYVGCVDKNQVLIQHGTSLYLLFTSPIFQELAYQYILDAFGIMPHRDIAPIDVSTALFQGLNDPRSHYDPEEHGPIDDLVKGMQAELISHADLLSEYFSFSLINNSITKVPIVCEGNLIGNMETIGELLIRLACDVDWKTEKACLDGVARELAYWYSEPPDVWEGDICDAYFRKRVFPYLRGHLKADVRNLTLGGSVLKLVSTEDLYRVFERC